MKAGKRIVEKIKTVILVVLFLLTILLLYLLWTGDGNPIVLPEILSFGNGQKDVPEIKSMIGPAYLVRGNGDGSFSVTPVDSGKGFLRVAALLEEMSRESISIGTVSIRQCKEALEQYPSSVYVFSCDLPYESVCDVAAVSGVGEDAIGHITRLMVSEAAPDSIIIFDDAENLAYRIAGESIVLKPEAPEETADDGGIFYSTERIFGCSGNALIPVGEQSRLGVCDMAERKDPEGTDAARQIFGDTFDFVRRMTDSFGTVTYMYGYAQKTMTVFSDGSYEYKTETVGESAGFRKDLEAALAFVSGCGGWDAGGGISYRLSSYTEAGSGRASSYRFYFSALLNGTEVCSDNGYPVVVGVDGGKVCYYYRDMFFCENVREQNAAAVSDAANVIASNANFMYKILNNSALAPNTDEALSFVAESLVTVSTGYYRNTTDNSLVPCHIVDLSGGHRFYFGLYDGTPLGLSQ